MKRLAALLLLGMVACDRGGVTEAGDATLPTTESSPPFSWWSMDPVPAVRIGALNGPPEYQFDRVAFAGRLSDGRFVVVDGGSSEVRWFGPHGAFQLRAGGRGEGPGEFLQVVSAAVTPKDSVVLYDFRNQRLTWFGPEGDLGRTVRLELHPAMTLVPLRDGRVVIAEERPHSNLGGAEYNYAQDSVRVMVTGGPSQQLDTVMHRAGREAATWVGYTDGRPTGTRQFGLPFSHPTLVGAVSEQIVLVENRRAELVFFNVAGEAVRLARRTDVEPPSLSATLRQEYVSHAVRSAAETGAPAQADRAGAEGLLEATPDGHRVSPFDRMLSDPGSGRVWVRDYVLEWNAGGPQPWTVHDSLGQVLGRVAIPTGLDVMQVGADFVVGVERDELGVEYVVAYSLERAH